MPRESEWLQHVPGALGCLRQSRVPAVDRAALERLLHVSRREAIRLMHRFGAVQAGRTFIVSREALIAQLQSVRDSGTYIQQARRIARISDEIGAAQRSLPGRQVRIAVKPDAGQEEMKSLPPGIHVRPGELRIEFSCTAELLRQLYELSQAILNDYARFDAAVAPRP